MPEQEFLPPPPGGEPPWANMPPIRPPRPSGHAGAGRMSPEYPLGSWQTADPSGSVDPRRPAEPDPDAQASEQAWADADRFDEVGEFGEFGGDAPPLPGAPRVQGGRARRAAARKRRQYYFVAGGLAGLIAGATVVGLVLGSGPGPASVVPNALITSFQPGELQQVPDACDSVPAGTVQQFLPGKVKVASPLPVDGSAESACNWSIDRAPVYRLLELNLLAYAPNGLASGNGSATQAAIDAYASSLRDTEHPPKNSPDPRATVTVLSGLGNEAFSSLQVFREGGAVTDVATVMVRYHNVIVTVTVNGLEHSNLGNYGPVSKAQLSAAALAFAEAAEARLL
ncbi:MAG: hypothetical protein ACRDOU_31155 [Streptosporangiaceae bacterium]